MSQSRPPAQLRARRFAQTAQSALFIACLIACLIVCLIAVSSLSSRLRCRWLVETPVPAHIRLAPYQLYRPALFQIRGPGRDISA